MGCIPNGCAIIWIFARSIIFPKNTQCLNFDAGVLTVQFFFSQPCSVSQGSSWIEGLHVNGMLKNHRLAKHLADANFGEIRRQLLYKKNLYRNVVYVIDRFYPSSKLCSWCGMIHHELNLADRTFICPVCGFRINRDLNAAINLNKGGRLLCLNQLNSSHY